MKRVATAFLVMGLVTLPRAGDAVFTGRYTVYKLPTAANVVVSQPTGINSAGQVAGWAAHPARHFRDPKPGIASARADVGSVP